MNSNKFDVFSNNLMISDMICERNWGGENFIQTFGDLDNTTYVEQYVNNTVPDQESVRIYTSQVGIHRLLYSALDKILPGSAEVKLFIMYLINAGILALFITTIVAYIFQSVGNIAGMIVATFILFASSLLKYGTNLYWMGWIIFLPLIISILCSKDIERRKLWVILAVSFVGNLIKNLCYYEFASSIMVATVIPFLFAAIKENLTLKRTSKLFITASVGALSGFAFSMLWKFILLIKYSHSIKIAADEFLIPIKMRVAGTANVDTFSDTIINSKSASGVEVIKIYLNTHDLGISSFTLSNKVLIIAILLSILLACVLMLKWYRRDRTLLSLTICTALSFVGPLSWMILAKPHAYIHRSPCAILWYIPLYFYGIPMCAYTSQKLFSTILLLKRKSN